MEGVRPAGPGDLGDLARLVADAVAELTPLRGGEMWARTLGRRPPFEEGIAAALADPDVLVLAGTVDDTLVGYAVARLDPMADGTALVVIDDLFTEPEARTVGVGEAMLAAIVEWGTERGAVGVDAVVLPGARETKNFFESFGLKARALVVHRDLP
jgi:GNAT superfamily N-acetyltransferase